jgi:hypothetical protein
MTYTLLSPQSLFSGVIRDVDHALIPDEPANTSWQEYQAWLAEGNTPNPYVPPPPAIPQQVPMWAVRTVLQNDGLFDQAQALINETSDVALKNVWEYGNFADRDSRAINVLAIELGLTDAQVDQMFIDANNLSV